MLTVLVTGASGRTGALIVRDLLLQPDAFTVRVVVRSSKARQLMASLGVSPANIFTLDLATPGHEAALAVALQGCEALVIATSAVPEPSLLGTLLGTLLAALRGAWMRVTGRAPADTADRPFVPVATWKGGQTPQQVDLHGQVAQIDAARAAGVAHIVLVSSAGGCDPKHFLNYIGCPNGDILNWKRAAEQYLVESGLTYTILHPNHLIDAPQGQHELVLGLDDTLQAGHWRTRLKMPRSLLALLAVASLQLPGAANRSIDCAGRPVHVAGAATTTTGQVQAALDALGPRNCSYEINDRTRPDAVWACGAHG